MQTILRRERWSECLTPKNGVPKIFIEPFRDVSASSQVYSLFHKFFFIMVCHSDLAQKRM